jgi:hypothetical protein
MVPLDYLDQVPLVPLVHKVLLALLGQLVHKAQQVLLDLMVQQAPWAVLVLLAVLDQQVLPGQVLPVL